MGEQSRIATALKSDDEEVTDNKLKAGQSMFSHIPFTAFFVLHKFTHF